MTSTLNAFSTRTGSVARGFLAIATLVTWADRAVAQTPPAPDQTPPAAASDKTTTGTVELGAGGVSEGSFKAGEYNGLENKGLFGIANVDLRGGGAYNSNSAYRWRIQGTDLGLETRSLLAEAGVQGKYRVTFGYSELLRNRSDSYQTPYNGAGTNTLTLPAGWLLPVVPSSSSTNNHTTTTSARGFIPGIDTAPYIDTQTTSPTIGKLITPNASQRALVDAGASADIPLFHTFDLSTKRTDYDAGLSAHFSPEWGVDLNVRTENKDGAKPMGTVSRNTGGDIATIIPDVIDTNTSQVNASLSYKGNRGSLQGGYYASIFSNNVKSMNWQNWATSAGTMNQMSSAPDNTFNQMNVEGRYKLSPSSQFVANGSYARNTQNDPFLVDKSTPVVPVSSLNGLVVTSAFGAKLTSRRHKVNLIAGYKFDDRDNKTGIHIFQYADASEDPVANASFPAGNPLGAVVAQNANANRPLSKKSNHANLEADYQFAQGQWVKGGYDFERVNRSCTGSWINCVDAGVTNENRLRAEWRADLSDTLNARVDYTFAARRAPDYNENAFLSLVPYAGVSPVGATGGATALSFMVANGFDGWGPALGYSATTGNMNLFFPNNNALANARYANNNRISELTGLRRYYVSDRNRNRLRSALDWQATEALSFTGGLDLTHDDYTAARYGLQSSKSAAVNLDGTYAVADGLNVTVFYTFENQRGITDGNTYTANSNVDNVNGFTALSGNSGCDTFTTLKQRNNNNKLDPCLDWSANMLDRINTVGLSLVKKAEKLTLTSDAVYSSARSTNDVSGGSWANNPLALPGAPAGTVAVYFIAAAPLPAVTTNTLDLRVNGTFAVAAHQSLRVIYAYMRMRSADWAYDGMQIGAGTLSGVLPTNETPFNYSVNVVGVSYIIAF